MSHNINETSPNSSLTTGSHPQGVVVADFNGDGLPDEAVANTSSNTVSVYINTGSGLLSTATYTITTGTTPYALVAGDFNGDGKTDLAVANEGSTGAAAVSVFYNSGSSINVTATSLAGGSHPAAIVAGDFNHDGQTDIAVANSSSNTVSVYINTGSALPTSAPSGSNLLTTGTTPEGIIAADFNGDGRPDLAVANYGSSTVSIFTNSGTALPTTATSTLTVGTNPIDVVAGDFNGDGKPDLAVSNTSSNTVSVFTNANGALPTTASYSLATGLTPTGIIAADFNGDGKTDLAVANYTSNTVSVFTNTGTVLPTLASSTLSTGANPYGLAVGDFNGDGQTDLTVTIESSTGASGASVFINQTTISTATTTINQGNGEVGEQINVAPGAVNNAFDIVGTNGQTLASFNSSGQETLGSASTGQGSFGNYYGMSAATSPVGLATGDFNGDGRTDMVVANYGSNTAFVYLCSNLDCTAVNYSLNTGSNPEYIAVGDFNGDGKPDIAITNGGSTGAAGVSVYLNTGVSGSLFSATASYTLTTGNNPWGIVTGDFNGDGKTDLAVTNHLTNTVSIYTNTGTALPPTASSTLTGLNAPYGLITGDFNGDGKTDLAVANFGSSGASGVSIFTNSGTALLTTASYTLTTGNTPVKVATGDFNGDGKTDLVVTNYGSATASVYINSGTVLPGTATSTLTTGTGPEGIRVADFNGDGKPDVVISNALSNTVSTYMNTGAVLSPTALYTFSGSNPQDVITGDFNGDGKPDIAYANTTTGIVEMILNSALGPSQLTVATANSTTAGITVQGSAGQGADLLQLQNSSGQTFLEAKTPRSISTVYSGLGAVLYVGADTSTNRSINAAGSINASGADYAEYIPWSGDKPSQGSIISYEGSNYVVSSTATAAFVGNDKYDADNSILVTFAGQVPVLVTGPVNAGDLLVPNGDGTARAVSPDSATVSDALNKVAVAQESNSDPGVKLVQAAVGTTANLPSNLQGSSGNFSDLNVTGTATMNNLVVTGTATIATLHVTGSATFDGDLTIAGHIITAGGQPTTQVQTAVGTGASVAVDGTDTTGTITITTGSDPTAGDLAKVLFSKTYGQAPHIVLSPSNNNAAGLRFYKGATSPTDFMFDALDNPQPNTTYQYDYFIAQ